jgi:hypothetical protein
MKTIRAINIYGRKEYLKNFGNHVLLGKIYAAAGIWRDVQDLRRMMAESDLG